MSPFYQKSILGVKENSLNVIWTRHDFENSLLRPSVSQISRPQQRHYLGASGFLTRLGHLLLLVSMRKARIHYASMYNFCPKSIDIACGEKGFEIEKR